MPGVFQDTVFAAVVRVVLGPTYFPHIDEMDPSCVYQKTVHFPKSSSTSITIGTDLGDPFNVHGRHGGNGVYVKQERSANDFQVGGDPESLEEASRELKLSKPVKEEGTDSKLVTWHGPDDPEVCSVLSFVPQIDVFAKNPMNWSRVKKIWVMFQLCFLTFSVYFGSAEISACSWRSASLLALSARQSLRREVQLLRTCTVPKKESMAWCSGALSPYVPPQRLPLLAALLFTRRAGYGRYGY